MKKNKGNSSKFEKYNFTDRHDTIVREDVSRSSVHLKTHKTNIFTKIKEWIITFVNYLIYQWKHNRLMFLLVLSLLFILGYYIYINYVNVKQDEVSQKHNNDFLQNFVKNNKLLSKTQKKKSIPKKHEIRCRTIMEQLFKAPFVSIRPDFLKYKTGKNLELDLYNEELNLVNFFERLNNQLTI